MQHQKDHAQALADGLVKHGIEATIYPERRDGTLPTEQVVACWGWRIGEVLRHAGKHVIVMERGFIDRMNYASLGWNGINGRARRDWKAESAERLHTLFPRAIKPWNPHGDYVLICGQVPGDSALKGVDISQWYAEAASACSKFGPIRFRPHPVAVDYGVKDHVVGAQVSHDGLAEDLRNACVVVTYNSNTGVDALLAGKPTIVRGRGSMATIAAKDWTIQPEPQRTGWAAQLAWSQFSIEEIRSGYAWDVIKDSQTEH